MPEPTIINRNNPMPFPGAPPPSMSQGLPLPQMPAIRPQVAQPPGTPPGQPPQQAPDLATLLQQQPPPEEETLVEQPQETPQETPAEAPFGLTPEWQREYAAALSKAQADQMAQQQAQLDAMRQNLINEYIGQLPLEQREYAKQMVAYADYVNNIQHQYGEAIGYIQQLEAAFLPMVKDTIFKGMSQQHQIEKELLAKYAQTPRDAELLVKFAADWRKRQNFDKRKTQGNDQVPNTSGQTNAATQSPELINKYRNTGKITDFIKARKAAGLW